MENHTTIALKSGKRIKVSEDADYIEGSIASTSERSILLTLLKEDVLNGEKSQEDVNVIIDAIEYWY